MKRTEVKELHPRDTDAKYLGPEPKFNTEVATTWDLAKAFSWYNHFYDNKDAKEFIAQYLDYSGKTDRAKLLRKVSDSDVKPTIGWLARCITRGGVVDNDTLAKLNTEIDRLVASVQQEVSCDTTLVVTNRPNVQELMRERTLSVGGELEGQWDDYIKSGAKKECTIKTIDELTRAKVLPQHVPMLTEIGRAHV